MSPELRGDIAAHRVDGETLSPRIRNERCDQRGRDPAPPDFGWNQGVFRRAHRAARGPGEPADRQLARQLRAALAAITARKPAESN